MNRAVFLLAAQGGEVEGRFRAGAPGWPSTRRTQMGAVPNNSEAAPGPPARWTRFILRATGEPIDPQQCPCLSLTVGAVYGLDNVVRLDRVQDLLEVDRQRNVVAVGLRFKRCIVSP